MRCQDANLFLLGFDYLYSGAGSARAAILRMVLNCRLRFKCETNFDYKQNT